MKFKLKWANRLFLRQNHMQVDNSLSSPYLIYRIYLIQFSVLNNRFYFESDKINKTLQALNKFKYIKFLYRLSIIFYNTLRLHTTNILLLKLVLLERYDNSTTVPGGHHIVVTPQVFIVILIIQTLHLLRADLLKQLLLPFQLFVVSHTERQVSKSVHSRAAKSSPYSYNSYFSMKFQRGVEC